MDAGDNSPSSFSTQQSPHIKTVSESELSTTATELLQDYMMTVGLQDKGVGGFSPHEGVQGLWDGDLDVLNTNLCWWKNIPSSSFSSKLYLET